MGMYMEIYNSRDVKKSRKLHHCHLCCLDIPEESACHYESGKFDGEFFSRYSHHECAGEWQDMNSDSYGDDEWIPFDEMGDDYPFVSFTEWKKQIIAKYGLGIMEE